MKKGITAVVLCFLLIGSGCRGNSPSGSGADGVQADAHVSTTSGLNIPQAGTYSDKALDPSYEEEGAVKILLKDTEIKVDGEGAKAEGSTVTITQKGTYIVSGKLADGQLVIDLSEDENVHVILQGADITCKSHAPILVESVKNLYLTLAEDSENVVSDGEKYTLRDEADETCAAIYSKDDLIINGSGSLTVNANYKDGINSRDDLFIISGTIEVNAEDDALVGKDSVVIRDGMMNLTAGGDAVKSSKQGDMENGYVIVDGGSLKIAAGDDAIHSETALVVNDGNIDISRCYEGLESLNIVINAGEIKLKASDDGINISGGEGIVADTGQDNGGDGEVPPEPQGGEMRRTPEEDADMSQPRGNGRTGDMRPQSGNEEAGMATQPPEDNFRGANGGGRSFGTDEVLDGAFVINGGTIHVIAEGDAIDSNGSILMTGGNVTAWGPENGGNGVLDYNGSFEITGGVLIAGCVSGMNQAPSGGSAQESFAVVMDSLAAAGSEVSIKDKTGNVLYTVTAGTAYNYLVVSAPEIKTGEEYTIEADGGETKVTGGDQSAAGGRR